MAVVSVTASIRPGPFCLQEGCELRGPTAQALEHGHIPIFFSPCAIGLMQYGTKPSIYPHRVVQKVAHTGMLTRAVDKLFVR